MSQFFGRSSLLDPAGIGTSKMADPTGLTAKAHQAADKVLDPAKLRQRYASALDPAGYTTFAEQAERKKQTSSLGY